jgi:hypothetical protein
VRLGRHSRSQHAIAEGKEVTIGRKLFLRAFGDEFNVERGPDQRPLPMSSHVRGEWVHETGPCSGLKPPGLADRAERMGNCKSCNLSDRSWSISGTSAARESAVSEIESNLLHIGPS